MSIVAGVDFGTQSVRVSIFDSQRGRLGSASADYPVFRTPEDPDHATQRHGDHMTALAEACRAALHAASIAGDAVAAMALDTTGSTVVPLAAGLEPLDDYYLWCDHRAKAEAAEITASARASGLEALAWCGGVYSSEWGFSKLLHWLRHNPGKRASMVTAMEHCDLVAAALCGITDPAQVPRSVCAMGHKWMWNASLGGLPPEEFLSSVDPVLAGVRGLIGGRYQTSDALAGHLTAEWAARLGLKAGIPIPVGAFDAHWDAIGAGIREGDVVNVVGTSTCMMAIAKQVGLIPGVCGVVQGSIHPGYYGIEAGLSAVGDIFEAIARRAGASVSALSEGLDSFRAGSSGLLRMSWDNGDRTVLVNPHLGGVTLGWTLTTTAADELFAAIEGTAFHTRIILERMAAHGVSINRVINGGGIPQKNPVLNRVYANVFNKPVLVPSQEVTSLGSAIFAFMAAGAFPTIEAAQAKLCPTYTVIQPDPAEAAVYEQLFVLYSKLYFALGQPGAAAAVIGDVLPALRTLRPSGTA
ncbi:MAG: ribulokinase [Candidatus Solibacter usitatus]|nr:ribulokinase [Candidatus Solibacter usitatus]